ncbi:MAG: NAD(P)-dependent oxidoreductase [Methanoregula sp.]|nr:NAD(P)-dependent oxidoreductase [Methanoregula sp.]
MKRILVTGANGFIGSRLVKKLLDRGYDVGILVRESSDLRSIDTILDRISVFRGDIRNCEDVSDTVVKFIPDVVMHLVTYYAVEHSSSEVNVMVETNVMGTINLLEAARMNKVKLFINTSTCAVYEQQDRALSEQDPVSPQNLYALTKLQAEEACRFYALNYSVDGITLRLFPPYGPGDHERRLIPYLIHAFSTNQTPQITSGEQKWDFIFVDDIVDAYIAVLTTYPFRERYDVINIGTGNPRSVRQIVQSIMKLMNKDIELSWGVLPHRKNELWYNSSDNKKAEDLLGWKPVTDIHDGLRMTIEYFSQERNV